MKVNDSVKDTKLNFASHTREIVRDEARMLVDRADRRARLAAALVGILDAWNAGVCCPTQCELIALVELCCDYDLPNAARAIADLARLEDK